MILLFAGRAADAKKLERILSGSTLSSATAWCAKKRKGRYPPLLRNAFHRVFRE
jgi:hypothetical protein